MCYFFTINNQGQAFVLTGVDHFQKTDCSSGAGKQDSFSKFQFKLCTLSAFQVKRGLIEG